MNATWARLGDRAIEALVYAAIGFGVLALGGVWPIFLAVTFGLFAAAICLWAAVRLFCGVEANAGDSGFLREELAQPLKMRSPWIWIFILAIAVYLLLQMTPLPAGMVKILSPRRAAQAEAFAQALPGLETQWLTLAMHPGRARQALAVVALALMAFVCGAYLAARRPRARRGILFLLGLSLVQALYGLVEFFSGHGYVLWFPGKPSDASGTFINRNHFAAFLSLFLPVSIGWFYYHAARTRSRYERTNRLPSTSWDALSAREGLWLLAPACLALAIVQSHSRGGFSSMLLGLALMFALGLRSPVARAFSALGAVVALTLFIYGLYSDYDIVFSRFLRLTGENELEGSRLGLWRESWGMFRDYPWFGVGLGAYAMAYNQYAQTSADLHPYMAHNEWLEGLLTLGIAGMALIVPAVAGFFVKSFRRLRYAGRDHPWLLGAWCGLVGLALHCVSEFNLHIPGIVAVAALLAGILLGFDLPGRYSNGGAPPQDEHA